MSSKSSSSDSDSSSSSSSATDVKKPAIAVKETKAVATVAKTADSSSSSDSDSSSSSSSSGSEATPTKVAVSAPAPVVSKEVESKVVESVKAAPKKDESSSDSDSSSSSSSSASLPKKTSNQTASATASAPAVETKKVEKTKKAEVEVKKPEASVTVSAKTKPADSSSSDSDSDSDSSSSSSSDDAKDSPQKPVSKTEVSTKAEVPAKTSSKESKKQPKKKSSDTKEGTKEGKQEQPEKFKLKVVDRLHSKMTKQQKANNRAFLARQSVEVGEADKDSTKARRHPSHADKLLEYWDEDIRTLYDNWCNAVKNFGGQRFYWKSKPTNQNFDQTLTYKEVDQRVANFGAGLLELGVSPKDKVGIFSKNRMEWLITAESLARHSCVTVAIYETFGLDVIPYVINHAEIQVVVASNWTDATSKLIATADKFERLKYIIQMDPLTDDQRDEVKEKAPKLKVMNFVEVEGFGKEKPRDPTPPQTNDLAVIMYTSGTTGLPKGVMLTHGNIIAATAGAVAISGGFNSTDRYLSYLPLAHIFERAALTSQIACGSTIGWYSGDPKKLTDDFQAFKPTFVCGVPRVFDRIYQAVNTRIETGGGLKKKLFKSALTSKSKSLSKIGMSFDQANEKHPIYNKLVFSKTKVAVGGNVKMFVSGGAPLNADIQTFVKSAFCAPVVQGYGLTETSAVSCIADPDDPNLGHVGGPAPCCEIKLVSVPEMKYEVSNKVPQGEICIRGPTISLGYYKDEKKTKEDFDSAGWFHTGDIGQWNENGTLSIIDRKKNIFKLSHGEYVAAEKLELSYVTSPYAAQIFVYGDSFTPFLVAVVRINEENVRAALAHQHIDPPATLVDLCKLDKVKQMLVQSFAEIKKQKGLMGFEEIKGVVLAAEEWLPENELVTPTFKLKRKDLYEKYKVQIVDLYNDIDSSLNLPGGSAKTEDKSDKKDKKKKGDKKKSDVKVEVKAEAKVEAKVEVKAEVKADKKKDSKTDVKKSDSKKKDSKSDVKAEVKADVKAETKKSKKETQKKEEPKKEEPKKAKDDSSSDSGSSSSSEEAPKKAQKKAEVKQAPKKVSSSSSGSSSSSDSDSGSSSSN